jgi:kumamolisin
MVQLPGTDRKPKKGARVVGPADPTHRITITVYVRRNPSAPPPPSLESDALKLPRQRKYLTHAEADKVFGAAQADLDKVAAFGRANGLTVLEADAARRSVSLSGTVADVSKAFGIELKQYETPTENYRGREGFIQVPADLQGVVEAVVGLDNRRLGRSLLRHAPARAAAAAHTLQPPPDGFLPPRLAELYNFPPDLDGTGQCIGIFTFNDVTGGYRVSALQTYFQQVLHLPAPAITNVVVHGRGNTPGSDSEAAGRRGDVTGEVMLDVQVAGALAPGAKLVMYFTQFTSQGWTDAITRAVTDAVNKPSVLSISYGNPEDDPGGAFPTTAEVRLIDGFLQRAAAQGLTICCAAGDTGSSDEVVPGPAHVDYPASSPSVLACGGTHLEASGSQITAENVWNNGVAPDGSIAGATGGGISTVFDRPPYQQGITLPPDGKALSKRGVPDVAGVADPQTGVVIIRVNGRELVPVGGTSATAPLWAALIARLNQGLGANVGFLNPLLYHNKKVSGALRDITDGDNGDFQAGTGWDACTGFGTPDGKRLLAALRG